MHVCFGLSELYLWQKLFKCNVLGMEVITISRAIEFTQELNFQNPSLVFMVAKQSHTKVAIKISFKIYILILREQSVIELLIYQHKWGKSTLKFTYALNTWNIWFIDRHANTAKCWYVMSATKIAESPLKEKYMSLCTWYICILGIWEKNFWRDTT